MRIIFLKIAIVFSISNCLAKKSFFMSDEESKEIFDALNQRQKVSSNVSKNPSLSGIFYIDENNWTVWIDDIPYSAIGQYKDFSINEASESGVYLTMPEGSSVFLSVSIK